MQGACDALAAGLQLTCGVFWGVQQVLVKVTIGEFAPVILAEVRFAMTNPCAVVVVPQA